MNETQGDLFSSPGAGDRRKRDGIERVLTNTPTDYKLRFEQTVKSLAIGTRFTSETITARIGQPPHHPNTVGALISALARAGVIHPTGERVKAVRPNQHSAKLEVWARSTR